MRELKRRSSLSDASRERAAEEAAARAVGESAGSAAREVNPAPEATRLLMRSLGTPPAGGAPLGNSERVFFAPHFGAAVDDVRIHTDRTAGTFANALGAEAFTRGSDIYFSPGRFAPGTAAGRRLLAHELTHATRDRAVGPQAIFRKTPAEEALALAKTINAALTAKKPDEKAVLTALGSVDRNATKAAALKTAYKTEFKTELEADLKAHLGADALARALFLLNGPKKETAKTTITVSAAGTEEHKAKVAGGEVSVHKDVEYTLKEGSPKRTGGFSVGFSTKGDASETRLMQTIWVEIVATQPDKSEQWVAGTAGSTNGTMDLTTDPKKPSYKIDSALKTSPFQDQGGRVNRDAKNVTNYDRPAEFSGTIGKKFDDGATKVVERDHFDSFIIVEEKPVYQTSLYVEWIYASKAGPPKRTTNFVAGSAITALPSDVKKQLVKEYPAYEYIR